MLTRPSVGDAVSKVPMKLSFRGEETFVTAAALRDVRSEKRVAQRRQRRRNAHRWSSLVRNAPYHGARRARSRRLARYVKRRASAAPSSTIGTTGITTSTLYQSGITPQSAHQWLYAKYANSAAAPAQTRRRLRPTHSATNPAAPFAKSQTT